MSRRFSEGDKVRVRADTPPGHIRTPMYLRGKSGVVIGDFGAWRNPELLAYGGSGEPKQINYWVKFSMSELWGTEGPFSPRDTVTAEIYGHWLEPDAGAQDARSVAAGRRK